MSEYDLPIPTPDFTLGTASTHNRWSAAIPPVLTVPSGAVVEVSGTAIEAPMRIVLTLEVMENVRGMVEPQYETDDYYAVEDFGDGGRAAHAGEHAYAEGDLREFISDGREGSGNCPTARPRRISPARTRARSPTCPLTFPPHDRLRPGPRLLLRPLAGVPNPPGGPRLAGMFRSASPSRADRAMLRPLLAAVPPPRFKRLRTQGGISLYEMARALHVARCRRAPLVRWINQFAVRPGVEHGE